MHVEAHQTFQVANLEPLQLLLGIVAVAYAVERFRGVGSGNLHQYFHAATKKREKRFLLAPRVSYTFFRPAIIGSRETMKWEEEKKKEGTYG